MHAAGGGLMDEKSTRYPALLAVPCLWHKDDIYFSIQYMVREHLLEEGQENLRPFGRGMFGNLCVNLSTVLCL